MERMNISRRYSSFIYKYYRSILTSAVENGYEFISFPMLKDRSQMGQRLCLLRHDCDNDLTAAVKMARIEEEMGVRSTYFLMLRSPLYNLLSVPNTKLVWEIIQGGHWIGLHFDELFYRDSAPEQLTDYVERERRTLFYEFNVPIDVVSFHQPSERVLNNQIGLDCINTYDLRNMGKIFYSSDSNMTWKKGCPSKIFRSKKFSRIQLLVHPEWWTGKEMAIKQKWNHMLHHNFELIQLSLIQRENTYNFSQRIRFYSNKSSNATRGNKMRRRKLWK